MIERYQVRDERGRVTGYVLRETPHRPNFRSGPRASPSESPLAVAACFAIGAVMLLATLAYLWAVAMAT